MRYRPGNLCPFCRHLSHATGFLLARHFQSLNALASLSAKQGNKEKELNYLDRIIERYPGDKYYVKTISKTAWTYYKERNYSKALKSFVPYIEMEQPSLIRAKAQYSLADSYYKLKQHRESLVEFKKLLSWIRKKENSPYRTGKSEKEVLSLLEKAMFFLGVCYSQITPPEEKVPVYCEQDIKAYDFFVDHFSQSALAPKAIRRKGAIQLAKGDFETAAATFNTLAQTHPDSKEGKNSFYFLVSSAIEVKQFDLARTSFTSMLQNATSYTPLQFAKIGQLMLNAAFYTEAEQAFSKVVDHIENPDVLQIALFSLGKSRYELKEYEQAILPLEELLEKFPNAAKFYDTKFILATVYRETEQHNKAITALSDIFRYSSDKVLINQASYDLGTIQQLQGDLSGALASFMRVALLADPADPNLRDLVEQCVWSAIQLAEELGKYQDAVDLCDQYIKDFSENRD
ncbi:MAG: tetratricopeptide repeat protein [Kiritimatiellae bacterium]|nr:tetratricopeptide repeat protein [Kiritimatiellia bacterium]